MSDYDDRILRDKLQRLGGHVPDENAAYADLQQSVRTAKRRRVTIASVGFAATCVAVLVVASLGGRNNQTVTTATDGATVPDITDVTEMADPTTTEAPATTIAATTVESTTTIAPETTMAPVVETAVPAAEPATPAAGSGSVRGTRPPASPLPAPTTTSRNTQPEPSEGPPSNPPAPITETKTFSAAHGSITVSLVDGHLELRGHRAQDGYAYLLEQNSEDRIRVTFGNDQHSSRIEVTIVDGRLSAEVDEDPSGSDGATSSTIDDHNDFTGGDGGSDPAPGHG